MSLTALVDVRLPALPLRPPGQGAPSASPRATTRPQVKRRRHGLEGRLGRAPSTASPARWPRPTDRATFDRLTGVANRQSLLAALFAEVERAARYERPLSVAFVDIDHFKAVNDTYGHAVGDVVLRGVAQTHRREPARLAT